MRYSKKVKKEIEKAEKVARKEAFKKQPKKRRKVTHDGESKDRSSTRWIADEWGNQGEVFFDGKIYWLTMFKQGREPGTLDAYPIGLDEKQWEEYKNHPIKSGIEGLLNQKEKVEQKSESTATEKPSSSTQRKTKSTKPSKKKPTKKSSTKSGKTATQPKQREWQWTSTSPKK